MTYHSTIKRATDTCHIPPRFFGSDVGEQLESGSQFLAQVAEARVRTPVDFGRQFVAATANDGLHSGAASV